MKKLFIITSTFNELYSVESNGNIGRTCPDGFVVRPSEQWKVTGAVEYRFVFGKQVMKRYSLQDIFDGKVPFQYKNGKQRCFITDYDHGTNRIWSNTHFVRVI